MKRFILILLTFFFVVGGNVGCTSPAKKRYEAAVQGVYRVHASLKAGRVDLAKKYSDEVVRVVPPPKKPVVIKPIEEKKEDGSTNKYIVLPQEYSGTPALTIGTKPFDDVVAKSPEIKKQLEKEEKEVVAYTKQVDEAVRATIKEADKPRSSVFSIFAWIGGGGVIGLIGLVALCFIFPPLVPIVMNVLGSVIGGINSGLSALAGLFKKKKTDE